MGYVSYHSQTSGVMRGGLTFAPDNQDQFGDAGIQNRMKKRNLVERDETFHK
jgi:hypothetical protein